MSRKRLQAAQFPHPWPLTRSRSYSSSGILRRALSRSRRRQPRRSARLSHAARRRARAAKSFSTRSCASVAAWPRQGTMRAQDSPSPSRRHALLHNLARALPRPPRPRPVLCPCPLFGLTLAQILSLFPLVAPSAVLDKVLELNQVTAQLSGQEARDRWLGQLFGVFSCLLPPSTCSVMIEMLRILILLITKTIVELLRPLYHLSLPPSSLCAC